MLVQSFHWLNTRLRCSVHRDHLDSLEKNVEMFSSMVFDQIALPYKTYIL